jgi:predicted dehydrogenase
MSKGISRRRFLKQAALMTAGAVGAPYIVPGKALGKQGAVAASNRIAVGLIGLGAMGKGHLGAFRNDDSVQVVAICDADRTKRENCTKQTNEFYAKKNNQGSYDGCKSYLDFQELCARPDVDALVIATPDHWHALVAMEALRNGKDVYLEKPMTHTVEEGKALVKTVRRYGRILQVGSQQRSDRSFRFACEMVRNGRIGKVTEVYGNVGGSPISDAQLKADPVPDGLDWDRWLGPAPWRPYSAELAPPDPFAGFPNWRSFRDIGGGGQCDFGAHHYDIAQWGLGTDDTGPVEVLYPDGKENKLLTYVYASGIRMYRGCLHDKAATEWVGTEGKVRVNRGAWLETDPDTVKTIPIGPNEIHLYWSEDQKNNWLESIRTRKEPICPVEIGHRTATICNIGNICYYLRRSLKWDPVKEEFVNDPEANRLLGYAMRSPWRIA